MALVTTFATTPLTLCFYAPQYRKQQRGLDGLNEPAPDAPVPGVGSFRPTSRYAVILQQFEHLPALFTFTKLIQAPLQLSSSRTSVSSELNEKTESTPSPDVSAARRPAVTINALRLVELTERTSAIIKASDSSATLVAADPLCQVFRTFAHGNGIPSTASLSIVGQDQFPAIVASHAAEHSSDLIVVPWALQGRAAHSQPGVVAGYLPSPFEGIFRRNGVAEGSPQYAAFVRRVFAECEPSTPRSPFSELTNTMNSLLRRRPVPRPRRRLDPSRLVWSRAPLLRLPRRHGRPCLP